MSWPVVELGSVVSFVGGSQPPKSTFKYEPEDGYVRLLQIRDYKSDKNLTFIPASSTKKFCKKDDVMIGRYGPPVFQILRGLEGAYNVALMKALPSEKVDKDYLYYFLKQDKLFRLIDGLSQRTAGQSGIDMDALKSYPMLLPPLEEQKRIAAILDKADAIRQKRKQAIDLADEFLRSVFLDMFGDPVTNPKGWEVRALGELATKVTDGEHQTPKREEKGYKLLSARNVQHGFLDIESEKVDYVGEAEFQRIAKRLSISKSDVLLSCSGTIGRVSMNTLNEPFCLVRSVAVIRLAEHGVIPEFLVGYLGTSVMQAIMKKEANSSGQPNLFQNQIKQLKVLVPPLELQAKYKAFLDHYKEKKIFLIGAQEQQALLFKSLSQKAFSGKL